MNILLVIFSLSFVGGAERVLTEMANYWAEKNWKVTVATFASGDEQLFYKLSPRVKHDQLNLASKSSNSLARLMNNYKRMKILKQYFLKKRPDLIISFAAKRNILTLLSAMNTGIPVIVSERNNPLTTSDDLTSRYLRKWLYPNASGVVCQTKEMLSYMRPYLKNNGMAIPNPVQKTDESLMSAEINLPKGKLIFAVGGMNSREKVYQKGFDLLIPVFNNLAYRHIDWNLVILGDGPERVNLQQMVKKYGLEDRVYLPGNVKNIFSVFKNGDLFVLSSRYEGFPNALCEAMSCRLPVVSFDCPTGPSEIVRDGFDGWLVKPEDVEGLENALNKMMESHTLRNEMGEKAEEIVERFSADKIMKQWENLIQRSLSDKKF